MMNLLREQRRTGARLGEPQSREQALERIDLGRRDAVLARGEAQRLALGVLLQREEFDARQLRAWRSVRVHRHEDVTTGTLGMTASGSTGGWKFDNKTGQLIANITAYQTR